MHEVNDLQRCVERYRMTWKDLWIAEDLVDDYTDMEEAEYESGVGSDHIRKEISQLYD